MEIRRVIYATITIEPVNRSLRKVIKDEGCLPQRRCRFQTDVSSDEQYLKKWNRPIKNWRVALSHFAILFPERFSA